MLNSAEAIAGLPIPLQGVPGTPVNVAASRMAEKLTHRRIFKRGAVVDLPPF
jgi:hypothetical protein